MTSFGYIIGYKIALLRGEAPFISKRVQRTYTEITGYLLRHGTSKDGFVHRKMGFLQKPSFLTVKLTSGLVGKVRNVISFSVIHKLKVKENVRIC